LRVQDKLTSSDNAGIELIGDKTSKITVGIIITGIGFLFLIIGPGIAIVTMILDTIFTESFFDNFGVIYGTLLMIVGGAMVLVGIKLNEIQEARSKNDVEE